MSSIGFHTAMTKRKKKEKKKKKKWLIFPRARARQAVPYLIKRARLRSAGHLISPFGVCWISDIAQLQLPVVLKCCRQSWLTKRSPWRHLRHWQRLLTGYFTVLHSFLTTKVSTFCPRFLRQSVLFSLSVSSGNLSFSSRPEEMKKSKRGDQKGKRKEKEVGKENERSGKKV